METPAGRARRQSWLRSAGKRMTSRMLGAPVRIITIRSMPMPRPRVGAILMLLLRALIALLYLLLTNVLSYLAALGATIVITEKILGWEHISYRIPLYVFILLVALRSDYNIFITTRICSEAMGARSPRRCREGTVSDRRRAHERRHHPLRDVPDPAVAAGKRPRLDRHQRGARRAHRHLPGAHGAGAETDRVNRAEGRTAGAALDEATRGTGYRRSCSVGFER